MPKKSQRFVDKILDAPATLWVLLCFFVVFFAYFVLPTYLNDYHELRLFSEFPKHDTLGYDLEDRLYFSDALMQGESPYLHNNFYPPMQSLFTVWFSKVGVNTSLKVMTGLTFLCFLAITGLWPLLQSPKRRLNALAVFALFSGLYSLGLWFELESGQFNVFAMTFCFAAIYLFHRFPRWRWLAYLLFIVSVNLKMYPGIFFFCFTTDWKDWKGNLKRWGLLLLGCFAALFVLGWKVFLDFVNALRSEYGQPRNVWVGNHSIDSFVRLVIEPYHTSNRELFLRLHAKLMWFKLPFYLFYAACLVWALLLTLRNKLSAVNPYLLIVLTVGALIIPGTSHDFKLSVLAAPMALFFNQFELVRSGSRWLDAFAILLLCLVTLSWSATLFVHTADLPLVLGSNLPALLLLMISTILLLKVRIAQSKHLRDSATLEDMR